MIRVCDTFEHNIIAWLNIEFKETYFTEYGIVLTKVQMVR